MELLASGAWPHKMIKVRAFLAVCGVGLALGGCSALPSAGPDAGDIDIAAVTSDRQDSVALGYAVVDVSPKVLSTLSDIGPGSLYRSFGAGDGGPAQILVGVGDTVQVTVFESSAGGLFIPTDAGARAGNFVQMPPQIVDQTGQISVPYAGMIKVKERSIPNIQKDIEAKLASRAIEPRVIVSLVNQTSSQVTVIGQVASLSTGNKININPAGDRVLDVLSKAGGISSAGYETFVTLQRRGKQATVYFINLVSTPQENVFVEPGDTLYVYQEKRSYTALGASGQPSQFYFGQEHLMLTDAVGRAGGLSDNQANPAQVFIYRFERRNLLEQMEVDLSMYPPDQRAIPTVYHANLRDPSGFFMARGFYMQDGDILFTANAETVALSKFLALLGGVSTITANAAATYSTAAPFVH